MRTIVIGDVHGCLEELEELLAKVSWKKGDRVILAGDLVDRGPDSPGVLRMAREREFEAVMGNHDEKQVRYRRHELLRMVNPKYKNPMKEFSPERLEEHKQYTGDDWEYLRNLPPFLRVNKEIVVVHAGVMPGVKMEDQLPNDCMRLRYIRKSKMKMAQANHVRDTPEDCVPWYDLWKGPETVIYGHQVTPNYLGEGGQYMLHGDGPLTIGIDGGCCFGGWLTAAVVTDKQEDGFRGLWDIHFESVRAKKVYRPLAPWADEA